MHARRLPALLLLAATIAVAAVLATASGQEIRSASPDQLRAWLRQYPAADANGDGTLTVEEAEAYRTRIEQRKSEQPADVPFAHEFTFATASDGVKIALAVGYPPGRDAQPDRRWPTIFSLCGYPSAVTPLDPGAFGDRCVTVNCSIRGAGASGGALGPWSERTRLDGYEVIENWIVKQPWSNGRVGIVGHSWPGLMGFLVATTNPPSLKAVCVSGLIEDAYRGICRPGGIANCGFPVDWLNNLHNPDGPFGSGAAARAVRRIDDKAYRAIVDSRPDPDLREDMLWRLIHKPLYDDQWRQLSLATHAGKVRAPILIAHAYQDEQTGPTGLWLWKAVPEDVPKRLVLSNGNHGITVSSTGEMAAWFQRWLLEENGDAADDPAVRVYFETRQEGRRGRLAFGMPLMADDFPLPGTQWTRYYLRSDRRLARNAPDAPDSRNTYRVGRGDNGGREDRLEYTLEFTEATALCGPIALTLWAEISTLDTDFFALLADQAPEGEVFGLQRGLLRASHRRLDPVLSIGVDLDGRKEWIRPIHSHTDPEPVQPHRPDCYLIEIPVLGHVFQPGHRLLLRLSSPPLGDPIGETRSGEPSYRYDSDPPPGVVKILTGGEHPSSLLLPILPKLPPLGPDPVPLDEQAGLQLAP